MHAGFSTAVFNVVDGKLRGRDANADRIVIVLQRNAKR